MSSYKPWANFEREITKRLVALGLSAKRNWASQFIQQDRCDVYAPPYVLQLKHMKNPSLRSAWDEARQACKKDEIPLGVCRFKKDRTTLVVMEFSEFEKLLSASIQPQSTT